jgi:polyhydroxybutyrate depolymerase
MGDIRRWRWGLALLPILLLDAGCAAARPLRAAPTDPTLTITVNGLVRFYVQHLPAPMPSGPVPVILAFHGGGGDGAGMASLTGLDALADRDGFIAVYPNGIDRHWNDGRRTIKNKVDDVGFISALLDRLEQLYPVDAGRIYATGISNGGMFTERLGCQLAGRIVAIAPVEGSMPADIAPTCQSAQPVTVLQIGGTADPIMPYDGGAVADFGGLGEGGVVLSVDRTMALWRSLDACAPPGPATRLPPIAPADDTVVFETNAAPCSAGADVTLLSILGGGHTWPDGPQYLPKFIIGRVSHQLDASSAIAGFFLALPARPSGDISQ